MVSFEIAAERTETMSRLPFTMAISHYDHVESVTSGRVEIAGTDPLFFELPIPEMFRRFINGQEWEVSEMSSAQYLVRRAAGDDRVIALPIPTSRLFRHTAIIVRRDRVREPADLVGARCGTAEWTTTAGVYARGLLSDMYGVRPRDMTWFQGGLDRPGRAEAVRPPALDDDVELHPVADRSLEEMIYAGDLDAIIAPQFPPGLTRAVETGEGPIGRLFDDPVAAEAEYLEKTGVFPIMHLIGIRRSFYEQNPWIAASVFRAFEEAKRIYFERLEDRSVSNAPLPLVGGFLERVRERFGDDPWPYGLEPNRHVFETLIRYEREQGLLAGEISVDELFVPAEVLAGAS
jgi:4,5-dihydroxyphthalate decarboxylase